ncbi:MAG: hypothetical protein KDM63_12865, partial [Verrucomicrobiae bacterium]|nr:hypothetical protein [Verrucomicrobiae bacterium]
MKRLLSLVIALSPGWAAAEIVPATFDLDAIRAVGSLETKVLQEWKPAAKVKGVRQKLIEITVCEWWPGQKVRLPVTLCAPDPGEGPCENVIVANMGLAPKAALPGGAMLKLLNERGVGVVLIGMGTIDAMEPVGKLHLGMREQLLKTKDARYTPAWIWGMSDMRALTAAMAEPAVFQPKRVLATGGSKRGVGAAICGIHDDRFTAILPVVAPMLGNPGGAYVRGSALLDEMAANEAFLEQLPPGPNPLGLPDTARQALLEREQRRIDQAITRDLALAAGWSEAEMQAMNDGAWDACRIAAHLDQVRARGLEFFYHVGTNDNVCPALRSLGERHPGFPLYILPGGQHGGPKSSGFTLQTPSQPEANENLLAFASHHFFGGDPLPATPMLRVEPDAKGTTLKVTVSMGEGIRPERNSVSWCVDRSPPYTYATEYDHWESKPLTKTAPGTFTTEIPIPAKASTLDLISTHTKTANG